MSLSCLERWAKLILRPEYRNFYSIVKELERIKNTPRYTYLTTNLFGPTLNLVDGLSFYHSYKEIFEHGIYHFKTSKRSPAIIDGGANIGLSIIYMKKLYPQCKIVAFEADPEIFEVLRLNVLSFNYNDVELINRALWNSETFIEFAVEGADGGRIVLSVDKEIKEKIQVPTVRLCNYLNKPIDFLKLDIEGAETDVILDSTDCLHNVENLFIEYHSFANTEQRLDELLYVLRKSRFRIQIHTQFSAPQPLLNRSTQLGMDMQINIFGYRD